MNAAIESEFAAVNSHEIQLEKLQAKFKKLKASAKQQYAQLKN
jgi:hypothetical protein